MALTEATPGDGAADANADDAVVMHTDGACIGNPGPGGWAAILRWRDHVREFSGYDPATTNNRMELMAAISGLEALKRPSKVILHTDSRYVLDGITRWMHGWKRNGWKTAARKPVKNVDLWQRLDAALGPHTVDWKWVRGHAGDPGNERADQLAGQAIVQARGAGRAG